MMAGQSHPSEIAVPVRKGAGVLASLAAIGSVLVASSCCLPVLPFVMAASFASGSAFLSAARPYLLAASVFFIAFGFYQARRASSQPDQFRSALDLRRVCVPLDLFPASNGECDREPSGKVT
jgi:hypothetical protein